MIQIRKPNDSGLSSILIAVSGNSSDDDAVKLGCKIVSQRTGILHVVYVIEIERELPIDAEITPATARGEEVLRHVEQMVTDSKFNVKAGLLQSRKAGLAVVQEAVSKSADAIVLGLPYKTEYGSFSLGDTIPYVLSNSPCRVIVSRGPVAHDLKVNGTPY